jgi:hypothetical protein
MSNEKKARKAWSTPRVSTIASADALLDRFRHTALTAAERKKLDRLAIEMRRGRSRSVAA